MITRKNARGGRSATEHLIAALRCLYRHAAADGLITDAENAALRVTKPRRLPSNRRAIPNHRLAEIIHTAATTGNDPDLDTLLLRLHTETACRRGGALALRPCDLDPEQCLIHLYEKGGTTRWQPVSPTLMHALLHHHEQRGSTPTEQLLRYRNGSPITARRYDHLWTRIGKHLPWVATQQITTHWLRHTTLTWVERHHGYAVARAYAGHTGKNDAGTTTTYITADLHEIATASPPSPANPTHSPSRKPDLSDRHNVADRAAAITSDDAYFRYRKLSFATCEGHLPACQSARSNSTRSWPLNQIRNDLSTIFILRAP